MMSKQAVLDVMRNDVGLESAPGEWFVVTQKLIDDYVDLTGETGWLNNIFISKVIRHDDIAQL